MQIRYQAVLYPEGTVAIHETTVDKEGNILSASYDAVRLEATTAGELEQLLRIAYKTLTTSKLISTEELEALVYEGESLNIYDDMDDSDDISNVISLSEFMR